MKMVKIVCCQLLLMHKLLPVTIHNENSCCRAGMGQKLLNKSNFSQPV